MLNSIIDLIEKPPAADVSSYQSTIERSNLDETNLNLKTIEQSDRFRKFLQLSLDYIYLFHDECSLFETFTLRLLDICLIGIAYLIEKRSNNLNSRHQMSLIMFRCGDIIKNIGLKLITIALDPDKQRFIFRIQILKSIIDQPNSKGIVEYLLMQDTQCSLYHQILIYLQILSNTTPAELEFEQSNSQDQKSFDSGHVTLVPIADRSQILTNAEESSHTVNISTKQSKLLIKRSPKVTITIEKSSSTDDEPDVGKRSNSSTTNDEQERMFKKNFDRSSSPSLSISSIGSELASTQQSLISNYQNTINTFRDLMRTINIQSLTVNDSNATQRRALNDYLLSSSSTLTCKKIIDENIVSKTQWNLSDIFTD
ncbi:unnamed protein product [Rotaria magnacalcarata]|uniref:Uncharacterized protein n=1 Tax=Rotaria magnacalcarata TaxID=392030 RepID=A0A8S3G9P6_9BILA|nr:unnamed protein product [Rotaria magnacalcarata]CAF5160051.1 unnamed protein product [Rotaria magnacalcarata]